MSRDWQGLAACRDSDPELFFPTADEGTPLGDAARTAAKRVCATCPVQAACLSYALDAAEPAGVWGGLSEGERRAVRRARKRAATADPVTSPEQPARVA